MAFMNSGGGITALTCQRVPARTLTGNAINFDKDKSFHQCIMIFCHLGIEGGFQFQDRSAHFLQNVDGDAIICFCEIGNIS